MPAWWPVPPLPLVVVGPPDVAAFLGGVLEYHDFFGYATAASVVFSQIFFLACDATIALIPVLRDLRRGRPFRPPGAFVFGHLGEKIGRKNIWSSRSC